MNKKSFNMLKNAAELIIMAAGEDIEDPNFVGTPERFAKSFSEFFWSEDDMQDQLEKVIKVEFPTSDGERYEGMIFKRGIRLWSFCPHHILPVELSLTIGYIPGEKGTVAGASKLTRIADILSRRMVLQETLAVDIADFIEKRLKAEGVAVVVDGKHDCMRMRGVKQPDSDYVTPIMRGSFKTNPVTRDEFYHLIMRK